MALLGFVLALFLVIAQTGEPASDPIVELSAKIAGGETQVQRDDKHGYLRSLLSILKIPISSQTLVFSKTSLQTDRISPTTPRALYFNDDVYVAWVPNASLIEIMSVHPEHGATFYMLEQEQEEPFGFVQSTGHECSICHYSRESPAKFIPRLLFESVIPDETGNIEGTFPIPTTDQTPFDKRWGGWYVTGTAAGQKHLGNIVLNKPVSPFGAAAGADLAKVSNVTDLSDRFDTTSYLTPHSDIVALMVLAHQAEIHNLIALTRKPNASPEEAGERLLKAMLFSGAEPLTAQVKGTSSFAADFARLGPADSRGRSLRDFDLNTRLFRYPLSYMIYSKAFDGMPEAVKDYVYRRLREVLRGEDLSKDFAHLSGSDRTAILEILRQTKPVLESR